MYNFLSLLILIFSLLNLLSAGRVPGLTTNLSLTRCEQQTALDVDFLMDLRMSHLFVQFFFATAVRACFLCSTHLWLCKLSHDMINQKW